MPRTVDWFVNHDFDEHPRIEAFKDFRVFLAFVFGKLGMCVPTRIQYDIAKTLQTCEGNMMIQAFRGVGKSWITGVYIVWRLYWNPALNALVVSASENKAAEMTTFCLRLITDIEELHWLHPSRKPRRHGQIVSSVKTLRESALKFDVGPSPHASQAPSVRATGITGQVTGSRADIIVADDIETAANSLTDTMREKLARTVLEFDRIIKPEVGQVVYLGTPQSEESIYRGLRDRGYRLFIWPMQYPRASRVAVYGDLLAPLLRRDIRGDPSLVGSGEDDEDGKPTDPERFNEEECLRRRLGDTKAGYALQFMLDPSGLDAAIHPLRIKNFIVFDAPTDQGPTQLVWSSSPEHTDKTHQCVGFQGDSFQRAERTIGDFAQYEQSLMFVDPSGRGIDETAYAVVKVLNGNVFVLKVGGFRDGYSGATLEGIAKVAKEYAVKEVVTEDNFGDGMFRTLLQPVLSQFHPGCGLRGEKVPNTVWKEKRIIDALEAPMEQHRIVLHSRVITEDLQPITGVALEDMHQYRLLWQLTRITREKKSLAHDDRLDALAGAVALVSKVFSLNTAKNASAVNQREYKRTVMSYLRDIGQEPRGSTWGGYFDKHSSGKPQPVRRRKNGGLTTSAIVFP